MGPVAPAGPSLTVERVAFAGGFLVRLEGVIDETFENAGVFDDLKGVVVIDLGGVTRITSYGVREWINALKNLGAEYHCFIRCRPAIVSQFNMVGDFGVNGEVVSIFAPYVCDDCGHDFDIPIDLRRQHAMVTSFSEPPVHCPSCNGEAEFDDLPESYFAYVATRPPPSVAGPAELVIDGVLGGPSARLRVTKEIEGRVTALWFSGALNSTARLKRVAHGLEGDVVVLMDQVTHANKEGIERFWGISSAPDAAVVLARVPLGVAQAFARSETGVGKATVCSIRINARCKSCHQEVNNDAPAAKLQRMLGDVAHSIMPGAPSSSSLDLLLCAHCHGELALPSEESLRTVLTLPLRDPPAAIGAYVASHDTSPDRRHGRGSAPRSSTASVTSEGLAPRSEATPGRVGRYETIRRIAEGGMATVYLGRIVGAGGFERKVAIKAMHPHIMRDPDSVVMFQDEARLAARIHHPNVVATLDINEGTDGLLIVMEYIEGNSLNRILKRMRKEGEVLLHSVSLRIMIDALNGLHAAHELVDDAGGPLELVHRDVSPHNLLIGVDGITRITDFGIARARVRLAHSTQTGQIKGKIRYMAPEQMRSEEVDRRADVYSAGVVLWEMLTGQPLFTGENEGSILLNALQGATTPPHELNPAIPAPIGEVCFRALAQQPDHRFATAAVFAETLENEAHACGLMISTARAVAKIIKPYLLIVDPLPSDNAPLPADDDETYKVPE